jgi:hypothetical protein
MGWIGILRVNIQTVLIARILLSLKEKLTLTTGTVAMTISIVTFAFSLHCLFVFVPLIFLAYGTGVSKPILTSKLANSVIQKETATVTWCKQLTE